MFRIMRIVLLLAIVAGLLGITPGRSCACFCIPPGSPAEELARSTAVFSGQVINIAPSSDPVWGDVESVRVTFRVSNVWKGPSRSTLAVLTARSGINCGYEFSAGQEYLVYAHGTEDRLEVWACSRTQPLSAVSEDLAALGAGNIPLVEVSNEVGIEVRASEHIAGKRETSQSFVYFVLWDWLKEGSELSAERVGLAFWNVPDKAPIVSSLRWHGSVYGGLVKKGVKLVLIEKIGDNARMTGPWEFNGNAPFRIGVDDQPLVAEMIESRVTVHHGQEALASHVTRYTVREGDTLGEISQVFGTTVGAIAQANNIVDPDLIFIGQVLVIPPQSPADN